MAYQTFPWVKGDSSSYDKLRLLNLPNLKGKSFLDVGCNEGYFCGYAEFCGAKKVTGIDRRPEFLAVARALFPGCQFICQDWDNLGEEKYDVILNASAIHYARDQKALIELLVSRLEPHGTLVLEIGVAPGDENRFVEVKRSIDTRLFPTQAKLEEMLAGYAWKAIDWSVPQAGDPIPRQVVHISRKLPYAILLLDDPFSGKSYTARHIFREGMRIVSGDALYKDILNGKQEAPPIIKKIIADNRARQDWSYITSLICGFGQFPVYCKWLAELMGHEDFVLDMYIPADRRETMARILEREGYYVVNVNLQKAVSRPRVQEKRPPDSCYRYLKYLREEFVINEEEYLAANPDVAKALAEGKITGALAHYIFHGRKEGRKRRPDDAGENGKAD